MSPAKHTVSWEYSDGSCGHVEVADEETARESANAYAEHSPSARVWLDDAIVQHGFLASDEHGSMW